VRYRLKDLPALLRTPLGRLQLLFGLCYETLPLLSAVARLYRCTLIRRTRIVAVVGSFGKTTTTRALRVALGKPVDPRFGVSSWNFKAPQVLRIRPGESHSVIEVGIDGPGQMAFFAKFINADIAVVTSIGSEHNRSFGTLETTRREKAEIVRELPPAGIAVLNGDDPNVLWMRNLTRARVITIGLAPTCDIYATDVALDWPGGTRFTLHANGLKRSVFTRLIGRTMVYPILAAVAVAQAEGLSLDQVLVALEQLAPTPGRLEPIRLPSGAIILRDDFKASLETVDAALEVMAEIPARRRIVVLGQISEPSGPQGPMYREIGARVAKIASPAIFVGANCQPYVTGAVHGGLPRTSIVKTGRSVSRGIEALRGFLSEGDVVLIKGRDTERLDRVSLALMGRTVACDISFCDAKVRCAGCPMLERGWKDLTVMI